MFIDLTEEQESLRKELESYFNDLMTPEVREQVKSADFAENKPYKELIKKIGKDGWLGVGWPVEHGGKGLR